RLRKRAITHNLHCAGISDHGTISKIRDGTAVVGEAEVVTSADLYSLVRLARPQAVIDGGRRQLPTGTRLTANQVALRARCCSRCSTASLAFDSLLSRRQLDGLSLSQLRRPPRWWISVLERDPNFHGPKGPAGCHHSRSHLQVNKQPINQEA